MTFFKFRRSYEYIQLADWMKRSKTDSIVALGKTGFHFHLRIKVSSISVDPLEAAANKAAVIYRVKFEYREAREMRIANPIYHSWLSLYWLAITHEGDSRQKKRLHMLSSEEKRRFVREFSGLANR